MRTWKVGLKHQADVALAQGPSWGRFCLPQVTHGHVWGHSRHHNWAVLLASSTERPKMLLNILQCTRKSTTMKNYSPHYANIEKTWFRQSNCSFRYTMLLTQNSMWLESKVEPMTILTLNQNLSPPYFRGSQDGHIKAVRRQNKGGETKITHKQLHQEQKMSLQGAAGSAFCLSAGSQHCQRQSTG